MIAQLTQDMRLGIEQHGGGAVLRSCVRCGSNLQRICEKPGSQKGKQQINPL